MLIYLIYSLFVGALWHFFVADVGYLGYWGLCFSLILTFYSAFLVRFLKAETKVDTIIKFSIPLTLLVYTLVAMSYYSWLAVLNPIIIASLLLAASLASSEKIPPLHYQFFALFFCYLYPFQMYESAWKTPVLGAEARRLQVGIPPQKSEPAPAPKPVADFNLAHFRFLNSSQDTVNIDPQGKFVIIETWNEKCPPCMRAIPEMISFYEEMQPYANHYYLYIPNRPIPQLDINKIFNFDKIKTKDKILLDQTLQKDLNLDSYPVFILFDPTGKQIYLHKGYEKEKIIADIKSRIAK